MKRISIVITILVTALMIAISQQSRLRDLENEAASFSEETKRALIESRGRSTRVPESKSEPTPQADLILLEDSFAEILIASRRENPSRVFLDPALRERLALIVSNLSPSEFSDALESFQSAAALAEILPNEIVETFLQNFSDYAPYASLNYLSNHPKTKNREQLLSRAFHQFSRENPRDAIRWFDEQARLGGPDIEKLRSTLLIAEATLDADNLLARAISPEFTANPDHIKGLGSSIAASLKDASQHHQFLGALRRAERKPNASPQLAKIRTDYVGEITQRMIRWPQEAVESLVDSEFTQDEKFIFASKASRYGALSGYARKGDWFMKIDQDTWVDWAEKSGQPSKHPAVSHLSTWARHSEKTAAAEWLAKQKPSPLKEKMTLEYAWTITEADPAAAEVYLPEIPESKGKKNLIKRINKATATDNR